MSDAGDLQEVKFFEDISNTAKSIGAIIGLFLMFITAYALIDNWKADALEFRQFKALYDCDKLRAERNDLQKRILMYEEQFGISCEDGNRANKEEYDKLKWNLTQVEKELDGCRIRRLE